MFMKGIHMEITSLSTALSNAATANSFGTAVLGKQLDVVNAEAAVMIQAMNSMPRAALERSVNPAVGSNIDVSV